MIWLVFAALWGWLALAPHDRSTWALENALVVLLGVAALVLRRRVQLTLGASLLLFAFLCLHEVGAHFTYSEVPYDALFERLTGKSLDALLGWKRNNYDRAVHFAGGLLLTSVLREVSAALLGIALLPARILAVTLAMAASLVYELIEWGAAALFGDGTGAAFLGSQGDAWDAQKDMALATLGSLLATGLSVLRMRRAPRD